MTAVAKTVHEREKLDPSRLPDTITAPRTDPIYNCHGYLTKVPVGAIEPFIHAFTKPDEVVADFFAGSGMTGLAAIRTGRKAKLSDISVLGQHIANGYLAQVDHRRFTEIAERVVDEARSAVGKLYTARRESDCAIVEMVRTVWSFTYECPSCGQDLIYHAHLSANGAPPKSCPGCKTDFVRRSWPRGRDVPVEVVIRNKEGRLDAQPPCDYDRAQIQTAERDPRQKEIPSLSIGKEREMFGRSGLGKSGLTETGKFFSPRNAIALLELWRSIDTVTDEMLRKKLQFAFTAILPRASRRYQWSAKRPLNAQNQTYYIAPVYYEWNVFELFQRKVEAAMRADNELSGDMPLFHRTSGDASYTIASADKLAHLSDGTVDYVFTDPPFGSNIFYSDMNLFHEAWLGETTNCSAEAVVHTTGKKKNGAEQRYEMLLSQAFREAHRVLKPGRYMSVVFGNSSGKIWGLVQRAIRDAGFHSNPVHVAVLDKGQRSVKGLNSGTERVATVDLILTVQKPLKSEKTGSNLGLRNGDTQTLIEEAIDEVDFGKSGSPSHVYASILRRAIQRHYPLDHLHLGDVLVALRAAGYAVDGKTGLLSKREVERAA